MSEVLQRNYPRGIPFKTPQQLAAQEARLRRWTYCLLAGAAVGLVLLVSGGVLLQKSMHDATADTPAPVSPTGADGGEIKVALRDAPVKKSRSPDKEWLQQAETTVEENVPHSSRTVPAPRQSKAVPLEKPAKKGAPKAAFPLAQHDLLLQTLAVLTVGQLYQSYLSIGLLADGKEGGAYQKTEAIQVLAEVTSTLTIVDRQLGKLLDMALEPEDRQDVRYIRQLNAQLQTQARELKAYWNNPDGEQQQKYQKAREAAWSAISRLLANEANKP